MIRSKIASRFKRAKTMSFLWALLALVLHVVPGAVVPAHAQGSRKDDIVFNSRGIPLAGATVRVCAMPASGQPCTPLALIYSDAALTQALANPTATDGLGNYFFYAAPGKYEIEISGPAITTKQIPIVILPNDPAYPNFAAVSAFSLKRSGNLTVNGNTTVVGNLASGTLNLANQSTPPGSAGSGTVNLYTKTADKRLYYKDDTGVESGPLGPGALRRLFQHFAAIYDRELHKREHFRHLGRCSRFSRRQQISRHQPWQRDCALSMWRGNGTFCSTCPHGDALRRDEWHYDIQLQIRGGRSERRLDGSKFTGHYDDGSGGAWHEHRQSDECGLEQYPWRRAGLYLLRELQHFHKRAHQYCRIYELSLQRQLHHHQHDLDNLHGLFADQPGACGDERIGFRYGVRAGLQYPEHACEQRGKHRRGRIERHGDALVGVPQ